MTAYFAVKLVHILATAVWFGGGLFLPGDIRRTLALGRPHADALVPRIKPSSGSAPAWSGPPGTASPTWSNRAAISPKRAGSHAASAC
jgi:hypothetical protein